MWNTKVKQAVVQDGSNARNAASAACANGKCLVCRDPPSKQDVSHRQSPLRMSDREASGSGQWQRSGEQSDDEWDAARQHHLSNSQQHDT